MKKQLLIMTIAGCLIGAVSCGVHGAYVEAQPADVVYTRPVAPGGRLYMD